MCLEEMCGIAVPKGALFYGAEHRRTPVVFDADLRALTERVAADTRSMIAAGRTPAPVLTPACRRCSLREACRPDRLQKPPTVERWLTAQLAE